MSIQLTRRFLEPVILEMLKGRQATWTRTLVLGNTTSLYDGNKLVFSITVDTAQKPTQVILVGNQEYIGLYDLFSIAKKLEEDYMPYIQITI